MRDALVGLLDKVDIAVAESRGVLSTSDLAPVARLASDIRFRLSYPDSVVVVALAGGTGSGKSSLFNALAGEEVALTGGIRPMTVQPLALVPATSAGSMSGYLEAIGITERVEHDGPPWLCLIDLPDTDSVHMDHRQQVDELLPRVDLVIWVTDPEKYRDASLHRGHLRPLAPYRQQFLFVINQVDRVDDEDTTAIVEDLKKALVEDGIEDPVVITTSAQPVAGPPIGIDQIMERLEAQRARKDTVDRKLLTDLARVASQLVSSSSGAHGVEFEKRWGRELDKAMALAVEGRLADAGHGLSVFVARLAEEVGGETGERLSEIAVDVPARFIECVAGAATSPEGHVERPSWWRDLLRKRRGSAEPDPDSGYERLEPVVDQVIGDPIRDLLARRGMAHASIADLALAVGNLERRIT
ncbi:MAG: GTPase [Acidimicrobiia bacterium]